MSTRGSARRPALSREGLWRGAIERCDKSGLTVREFCRKQGINPSTLSWWRWELRRRAAKPQGGKSKGPVPGSRRFLPVEVVGIPHAPQSPCEREACPRAQAIEILLGGNRRIRVAQGFDAETLHRVLSVLEAPGC